jgi:hypothetical protein
MIRVLATSLTLAISTTACLSERREQSSERGNTPRLASDSGECGKPGSATDLSEEPGYSANYLHRWTTAEGCPVRLDIIMTRRGPDACGGTKVADILMGWPLGSSHQKPHPFRIFVRDPHNVFGDSQISRGFDEDAELPGDAVDTGYRQDEAELWMRPHDDAFIYLVHEDKVEQWPHDETPPGCA